MLALGGGSKQGRDRVRLVCSFFPSCGFEEGFPFDLHPLLLASSLSLKCLGQKKTSLPLPNSQIEAPFIR